MPTLVCAPHMQRTLVQQPVLFVVPLASVLAIANIPREVHFGRDFRAFLSSCAAVVLLLALFGIGMYPNMLYSSPNPEYSLTIYNAAASAKTHSIMFVIALIGMPVVLAYTVSVYWIFRGKVTLDQYSY